MGGATVMYREPAILTFRDFENGRLYRYRTEVRIGARTGSGSNLPSLLGYVTVRWDLLLSDSSCCYLMIGGVGRVPSNW